jgi:hypothetical protein
MNHTTRVAIRIFIAAALAVAGTNLGILQQQSHAASHAEKHEQNTIQNLRDNFEKTSSASQHLDQENLCLRAGKCSNSNVGEQTLGNDNSVTGFADQSKNVQATVTPTVTPTPTPTVTPTPTPTVTPTPTPTVTPTPTPTVTPTPTPIPEPCGRGTTFDATLQASLAGNVPKGTVLCLQSAGLNTEITGILPPPPVLFVLLNVVVAQAGPGDQCASPFVAAAVTSGVLPASLSGTNVCVLRIL